MNKVFVGCLTVMGVFLFLAVSIGGFCVGQFNNLRTKDEICSNHLAEIDNQLQRKSDLVPNLVQTVKGYAKHEDKIMTAVADAHRAMLNATTPTDKLAASDGLSSALGKLLMLTENYPNLKADKQFIMLQDQLEGTENRITVARMDYNKSARELNTEIRTFPGSMFAGIAGVEKRQYFEASIEARKNNVKVEF